MDTFWIYILSFLLGIALSADAGMMKKLDSPKKDICILECDDFCVWVDEKLLNYFSGMPCHYKGKSPKNPVMVYLGDSLIGLIMPIRQP